MNIDGLVKKQRGYFDSGKTRSVDFRLEKLRALKAEMKLREGRIHFLGSDSHNMDTRPPRLGKAPGRRPDFSASPPVPAPPSAFWFPGCSWARHAPKCARQKTALLRPTAGRRQ